MQPSRQDPSEFPSLTLLRQVVLICEKFEAEWKAGRRPRIESFLSGTSEADLPRLLYELLALKLELRRKANESPQLSEYLARFSEQQSVVESAFASLRRSADTNLLNLSTPPLGGSLPDSSPGAFQVGQVVDGYTVRARLGSGGMGVVYLAEETSAAKRLIALKCVRPDFLEGLRPQARAEALSRFRLEIEAISRLDHPHLVPVYYVGQINGAPYFSMKYLEGGTLAKRLESGPLPAQEAAGLMEKAARAVHHAHEKKILHRDVKPGNILFDRAGEPYVADFGLAKQLEPMQMQATPSRAELGTPAYMSPEQARGKESLDARTDVYGLGATLYHVLVGRPPFEAAFVAETLRRVIDEEPVPPRFFNPAVDRDLEIICLKCLEKCPSRRFATAAELADELQRVQRGEPIQTRPAGLGRKVGRWSRRNANWFGLTAAATIVAVSLIIGFRPRLEVLPTPRVPTPEMLPGTMPNTLYASKMQQVMDNIKKGEADTCWQLLASPDLNFHSDDPRGFEWHYRWRQSARNRCVMDGGARGLGLQVRVSPNGKFVYTLGFDLRLRKWEVATGQCISRTALPVGGSMYGVAFSPDAKRLFVSAGDGRRQKIQIWSLEGDEPAAIEPGIDMIAHGVPIFASDRRAVFLGARDAANATTNICIWDSGSGSIRHVCSASPESPFAISVDGNQLAVGCPAQPNHQQSIRIYDLKSEPAKERLVQLSSHRALSGIAFSPDGQTIVVGDEGGHIYFVRLSVEQMAPRVPVHLPIVPSVTDRIVFSPDGKRFACRSWHAKSPASVDHWLSIFDANDGERIRSWKTDHSVDGMDFTADSRALIVGTAKGLNYIAVESIPDADRWTCPDLVEAWSVAYSPSGDTLAVSGETHWLGLLDPADGRVRKRMPRLDAMVGCVAWSPNGEFLVSGGDQCGANGKASKNVQIWNRDGTHRMELDGHNKPVRCVAVSPDSGTIASGAKDRSVCLWDAGSGALLAKLPHDENVNEVLFAENGDFLVAITDGGDLCLWRWREGKKIDVFTDRSPIGCAAISRKSHLLATANKSGFIHLWLTTNGKLTYVRSINGPGGSRAIALSPDGNSLVIAGEDNIIRFVQVSSGLEVMQLTGLESQVHRLDFSPDGQRLAAAPHQGGIRIYHAPAVQDPSPFLP